MDDTEKCNGIMIYSYDNYYLLMIMIIAFSDKHIIHYSS